MTSVPRKKSAKTSKLLLKRWLMALDEIPDVCSSCCWVTLISLL